jgi:hypothetical protein
MMEHELENVPSHRVTSLAKKLRSKKYRDSYLSSHIRMFLANQLSSLRGEMSQQEFGQLLGKPQPIVSRLQNPDYGKYSLQTLLEIASKLDVALLVRFVDYPTFLKITSDFSDEALRPASFDPEQLDRLAAAPRYIHAPAIATGVMAPALAGGGKSFMGAPIETNRGLSPSGPARNLSIGGTKHD